MIARAPWPRPPARARTPGRPDVDGPGAGQRRDALARHQVDAELFPGPPDTVVMRCLPMHGGDTSNVMGGTRSIIFELAENRLHAQKALLVEPPVG